MRTLLQTLFFFLLVTHLCFAQWYQQNSGTTEILNSVSFINNNTGVAVGDNNNIIRTTNGGATWTNIGKQYNGQEKSAWYTFHSIAFTDSTHGTAVGEVLEYGFLCNTSDAGVTWLQAPGQFNLPLNEVTFSNSNCLTAVGGINYLGAIGSNIFHSTDRGISWGLQFATDSVLFLSVSFTDSLTGTVVGSGGTIMHTINGGVSWETQFSGTENDLTDVYFIDANLGFTVGYEGTIIHTTDGGSHWMSQLSGTLNALHEVSFSDEIVGFAVGDNGTILRTTDGGTHWIPQISGTINHLYGVWMVSADTVFAVGGGGLVLCTANGGTTEVDDRLQIEIPINFILNQNYPNPFNPSTRIKYSVPSSSQVTIKVFDVLGNEIETLVNEEKPIGTYELTFNAAILPSGVYFYQLKAGEFISTKKMILIK